jgi:hypothetical protein
MATTTVKGKRTNSRKFPGIAGSRPDKATYRREEAAKRNAAYAALPEEEKKARNPKKYEKKS